MRASILLVLLACLTFRASAAEPAWAENVKKIHASFKGTPGQVAQFGDSITFTMAFFTPMLYQPSNVPADLAPTLKWMVEYIQKPCWRDIKGGEWGNQSGTTSDWGLGNMDGWLKKQNPEVALIMWGTNDAKHGPVGKYKSIMAGIVDKCIANGTIPVLYTIPPFASQGKDPNQAKLVEGYVTAVREVAAEKKVPLIDFYKAIMDRQPKDFGTTLMGDELHPSYPDGHQNNFSEDDLKLSGYSLRNYLTLVAFKDLQPYLKK